MLKQHCDAIETLVNKLAGIRCGIELNHIKAGDWEVVVSVNFGDMGQYSVRITRAIMSFTGHDDARFYQYQQSGEVGLCYKVKLSELK
jgi:hypothetical protein